MAEKVLDGLLKNFWTGFENLAVILFETERRCLHVMVVNLLKGAGAEVNFYQVFFLIKFIYNPHKDVVLYKLIHCLRVDLVMNALSADYEGRCGPINVLVLAQPFEPKDNVISLYISHRGS